MELFGKVNIDWLGKKWYFLSFSLIFSVLGIISMCMHWAQIGSPVPLGVDFKGGTQVKVKFEQTPDINRIRQAVSAAGIKDASVQPIADFNQTGGNEMLISLPEQQNEAELDSGRKQIVDALRTYYPN
ncbi:MAG: protein translocase subunit SecF, partial [Terracidiphilus sp.]